MLAGIRRGPGPLIGTVVASAAAAVLTVAAISTAAAHTEAPAGRLASASVVVAGSTNLSVTLGRGQGAEHETLPLPAYRGVPASLARRLAQVPGAASAAGESGFPNGTVPPGDVDLVAVTARPGVSPDVLAGQIRAALHGGQGYTIATGAARGDVANLNAAVERSNGQSLAGALIAPIVLISLFVLASATALAVNLRRRRFALLRAVGATRGQVRRAILAELAVCGAVGGALGWLPGAALGALSVRALAAHQMLPAGSAAWLSPWLAAIACGASALVAGTPYRATVSAIYSRSLASGDLLIPASVAAGHTGTPPGYSQILVSGGTAAELARLAAGHPGLRVASRSVANAQSAQAAAQNSFANDLILGVLGVLSAVALVNTLVVMTVERRRVLRLLGRVGATRGQVAAVFGWQAVFVAGTGLVAGAAAGAVTLLAVTRAVTGSWGPFIPLAPAVGLIAAVAVLTAGAVMIPFGVMSRRELSS